MKKKVLVFILVMTCVFSCFQVVYGLTPPPQIGGTIFLPEGKVAPTEGIKLKITAECPESIATCERTINEGENSAPYSFAIYSMVGGLEIRCELMTPVNGYYDVSYYTGSSQKPFKSDAVKLTDMSRSSFNFNITLVESKKVTGEIILPDVTPVQRDSSVTLDFIAKSELRTIADGDPYFKEYFSKDINVVIKEGGKSGKFEVDLPVYSDEYYYEYKLNEYISGVSPSSNMFDLSNRLLDESSISIVLDKGNVISGEVQLPEGEVAGKGGFPVNVSAIYYTTHNSIAGPVKRPDYIDRRVIIPEGENSIGYEVSVYPEYSIYYMQYSLDESMHVNRGYYSPAGTVTKLDNDNCAVKVNEDVKGIDLCVLNGVKLFGKIMCPKGEAALEDLTGILTLYNDYNLSDYKYVIEKGSSFATYEFTVPEDLEDFVLRYQLDESKYVGMGFYNDSGTTTEYAKAQRLSMKNNSIENMQFYILGNKKISGKICLPEDLVSINKPQRYVVSVLSKNADGTYKIIKNAFCDIAPSERSALFELVIPEEYDEVIISYSIAPNLANDFPLVTGGYLGEDGMVLEMENAKVISPGQGSTDVELVPIKGVRISGVITVDEEHQYFIDRNVFLGYEIILEEELELGVLDSLYWVDKALDSQEYFIDIPPSFIGKKFKIRLDLWNSRIHLFYLTEDGLTEDSNNAKVFTVDGIDIKDLDISFGKLPSVVYGDVNSDGKVNSIDLAKFRGYLLGLIEQDEIALKNSDLNLDGNLNSIDFALLRQYLLKIINKLPVTSTATILNYDFDKGNIGAWNLNEINGGEADYGVENGELLLKVHNAGIEPLGVRLTHKIPSLRAGTTYKIEFKIKSTKDAKVYPKIGDIGEPFREVWHLADWSTLTLPANQVVSVSETFVPEATCPEGEIAFNFGGSLAGKVPYDIFIDDVVITEK